jgi:hypothetical protein
MKKRNEYASFREVRYHIVLELGKPHIELDDFEKYLQAGDILLFSGKSSTSWRIRWWMPYPTTLWSHVGLVVKFENPDFYKTTQNPTQKCLKNPHYFLVESIGVGVRLLPLELAFKNYKHNKPYQGNIIVMRNNALNIKKYSDPTDVQERQRIIHDFVLFYQNTPFDNPDFFKMAFRVLLLRVSILKHLFWKHYYFRKKPPFICTELVYNAFQEAGIKMPHTPGVISPEDFWYDENNVPVCVLK